MLTYLALIAGLVLLVFSGDFLVRGAVGLAERLSIPALIIGLTIIAFGTSAPELVISLEAALKGLSGIAIGNVVGSNIANILLVLGAPAIVYVTKCHGAGAKRNAIFMIIVTLAFIFLMRDGLLSRLDGGVLLFLLGVFLYDNYRRTRQHRKNTQTSINEAFSYLGSKPLLYLLAFTLAGLIGLPLGAKLTVHSASEIARLWGISETAIGVTAVAIGTSLPELATCLMAVVRKQSALAIGNIIGSNIFNILAIMGITSATIPLEVMPELFKLDIWAMLAAAFMPLPFIFLRKPIPRFMGASMLGAYIAFVIVTLQN